MDRIKYRELAIGDKVANYFRAATIFSESGINF